MQSVSEILDAGLVDVWEPRIEALENREGPRSLVYSLPGYGLGG
jgi:hypothetical protein